MREKNNFSVKNLKLQETVSKIRMYSGFSYQLIHLMFV